ncbi:MAG: cell division protein FtsW [Alphaproteobacteria bacterium]|nr:MAG: cell division protein FtsW [Alphaproteobacteria bacterium]
MPDLLTPRSNSRLMTWWWSLDRVSVFCILALAAFGVVMVATASPPVAARIGLGGFDFLKKHVFFLAVSLGAMVVITAFKPTHIWRIASLLFIGAWVGVLLTLLSGVEVKGATRWIYVFGFSIQPSEFLKPAFVVLAAFFLSKQKQDEGFPGVIIALGLYALSVGALILQPDFGMTFLMSFVFAAMIFLAGCPLRYVVAIAGIGAMGITLAYFSLSHVQSRIDRFLFPDSGDSYQIDRSLEAFMNGGFMGTGPGQGTVKLQIPDVHADFIFSAVGEEWGFVFTALLVCVFAFLFYRMMGRFSRSESLFAMLAGSGLVMMLVIQTIIHMGSALRLLPAKGMTLPFISYGGSSLIAVGISFGLILALSRGIIDHQRQSGWRHLTRKEF